MPAPDVCTMTTEDFGVVLTRALSSNVEHRLLNEKSRSNLAELIAYAGVLRSELPAQSDSSGFSEYFEHVSRLKAGAVQAVFGTPQGFFWNAVTRALLEAKFHSGSRPLLLQQYLGPSDENLDIAIERHLHEFGRFALAASAKAGQDAIFDRPVRLKGPSVLPGIGIALLPESIGAEFELRELNETLVSAGENARYGEKLQQWPGVTVLRMPSWQGPLGHIVVDGWDPVFNFSWIERYPRLHKPEACKEFAATLSSALQCIDRYEPGLAESISLIIDSITPMDTRESGAEMCSGTFSPMFGACFLSDTPEPMFVAEMLVHEFCHTRLRLAQESISLFKTENPGPAVYYSPWRDDPRPLDALAHGLFVFGRIARFWLNVHGSGSESPMTRELALRRLGTLIYQLRYAFREFTDNAGLTAYGAVFANVLEDWIRELDAAVRPEQYEGLLPFFSGVIRDSGLRHLPIGDALPRHKINFEQAHSWRSQGAGLQ